MVHLLAIEVSFSLLVAIDISVTDISLGILALQVVIELLQFL